MLPAGIPAPQIPLPSAGDPIAQAPLAIWYVAVVVLGASTLSGAPRKSVAWVLGGLYVVILALIAAMAAMGARG